MSKNTRLKKLIIIGASGFGREVAWLVERINENNPTWDLVGFLDDDLSIQGKEINGYKVLGTVDTIPTYADAYFVCAIGSSKIRKSVVEKVYRADSKIKFATLVDPSVECSKSVNIGEGSIICAHSIMTVDIEIGKHNVINLDCTIGHDSTLKDFVTLYPSVNVSGMCNIGQCTEIGTGAKIIQEKNICDECIVGAGAVVIKDIKQSGVYVGIPAELR